MAFNFNDFREKNSQALENNYPISRLTATINRLNLNNPQSDEEKIRRIQLLHAYDCYDHVLNETEALYKEATEKNNLETIKALDTLLSNEIIPQIELCQRNLTGSRPGF